MGKKKSDEEYCEPCNHQIAADMALGVCSTIEKETGINCSLLHQKVKSGKMKPLAAAKKILDVARKKGLPEADQLEEIYRLGKEGA